MPTTEDEPLTITRVDVNDEDVVYGRGNHLKMHPGNIHYRSLVQAIKHYYVLFANDKKQLVSMLVYESIKAQNRPGRFLIRYKEGTIAELDTDNAVRKISQCMREKQKSDPVPIPSNPDSKMSEEEISLTLSKIRVRFVCRFSFRLLLTFGIYTRHIKCIIC